MSPSGSPVQERSKTTAEAEVPSGPGAKRSVPFALVGAMFFFSGASGLLDQLCFSKYLGYIVGSTAHAVSAVLAAFMTGLSLGAALAGRYARRIERPLLGYGVLEVIIAACVFAVPAAFDSLTKIYATLAAGAGNNLVFLSVLRWAIALVLVIVPTTAMGATFPLLSRMLRANFEGEEAGARKIGWLYALNTGGGALGALLSAYLVLPALGIRGTLQLGASLSLAVGVVSIILGFSNRTESEPEESGPRSDVFAMAPGFAEPSKTLLVLAFLSGALVFSAEVVSTHLLALLIGNSAYAFGLILAVFLSCLFFGASLAPRLRTKLPRLALPLSLLLSGAALVVLLPAWDLLPLLFRERGEVLKSFEARETVRGFVAFAILFLPTTAMGLTFPLLLRQVSERADVAAWIGRLTTVNTVGTVFGSLVTGYFVLPLLGSEKTLLALGFTFALAGCLSAYPLGGPSRKFALGSGVAIVLFGILLPRWDLGRLTNGANVYFDAGNAPDSVPFVREDVQGGVTTVAVKGKVHTLYTNGKFQGNDGWEMKAQRSFAHYPSLFVKNYDRALVIGLGTGTTLGTITAYPWKRIDLVEISPAIVEGADKYFNVQNRNSLHDPRVAVTIADGRNHLFIQKERYDLISMELSSIWFSGAASLYSRDFYELVSARLERDGIFQQWVQLHHVTSRDFATIVHTLRLVFPHVALFYGGGQGILVASKLPLRTSASAVTEVFSKGEVRALLPDGKEPLDLLDEVLLEGADLDRFLSTVAAESKEPLASLVSTDDNIYLEFATPRGNVLPWSSREALVEKLRSFRTHPARATLASGG